MLPYPSINPVAFSLGPVQVHWYGLMYLFGFITAWWLANWRAKQYHLHWNREAIDDLIFYGALGVILGGRIGYVFFYNTAHFLAHPLGIFKLWEGGMSFHGGLIGVLIAMAWVAHKTQKPWLEVTDFIAPLVPLGLAFGRMGNFINGELWGRVTDVPWAMVFPHSGNVGRHPSQLYEFALEGVLLFVIVWWYSSKPRPRGCVSAVFLMGYAVSRLIAECFRQPDAQLGFLAFHWVTMGQILSIPMLLGGIGLWWVQRCKPI
jgi:phosphatidylglycerol:prolipoprotein diacylglycerol transferase